MRIFAAGAIALGLAGCAGGQGMVRTDLAATLTAQQAVPGPGEAGGTGTAELRVDPANARLCWELNVRGIAAPTAALLHRGAAGAAGPAVVTLTTPDASGRSQGCASVEQQLARAIVLAPHDFYLAVPTRAHPAGAIRGQLRGRGPLRPAPRGG